jgi:signal transduction histidine kinase
LLAAKALWLCRIRWGAVATLVVFGVLGLATEGWEPLGIVLRADWPLVMAAGLVAANSAFTVHARFLVRSKAEHGAGLNISMQMALDLVAHTFVVHFLGSLETYALFIYIFHIVLACIIFDRKRSLAFAMAACILYATCFALEATGAVSPTSVYASAAGVGHVPRATSTAVINMLSAIAIWLCTWYFANYMSSLVRQRDAKLAETNRRLVSVQEERTRHLLRTTHELKAPFAAIHANTQLLLKGHCGELTENAHSVVLRIAARARRLTREIQEMLQLANLRSEVEDPPPEEELDLAAVINESGDHIEPMAIERKVKLERNLRPVNIRAARGHLRMLLDNLLSNAVVYSHEGGSVYVECDRPAGAGPTVMIEDHGIGIPEHKLPLIFNEYYRTDEAAQFNKESNGLGLTIAKHIAQEHGIGVSVESRVGEGTKFMLRMPRAWCTQVAPR